MFLDSSALVAILLGESDAMVLRAKLKANRRFTSPIVIYETTMAVMRDNQKSMTEAHAKVMALLKAYRVQILQIQGHHAELALEACARFGRGSRHPAKLNMGDCFSYACAVKLDVPLLFIGNDFIQTEGIKFA